MVVSQSHGAGPFRRKTAHLAMAERPHGCGLPRRCSLVSAKRVCRSTQCSVVCEPKWPCDACARRNSGASGGAWPGPEPEPPVARAAIRCVVWPRRSPRPGERRRLRPSLPLFRMERHSKLARAREAFEEAQQRESKIRASECVLLPRSADASLGNAASLGAFCKLD